jgi:PAS domain S-box-containing protein
VAVGRQVTILSFPSDDETLRRLVEDLLNDPAIVSPAGLETRLRPVYPQVTVRERGLAGERAETWYVYRDGRYLGGVAEPGWWTTPGTAWLEYDSDGRVTIASEEFSRLIGATPEAIAGRHFTEFVPADAADPVERLYAILQEQGWIMSVARVIADDGQPVDIEHREELTPTGMRSFVRPVAIAQRAVA